MRGLLYNVSVAIYGVLKVKAVKTRLLKVDVFYYTISSLYNCTPSVRQALVIR